MEGAPSPAGGGAARWVSAAAFAGAAALGAAFFLHTRFVNDDALITVRCAEHLAHGDGLVYNAGERVLGTTSPLWALVLAAAEWTGVGAVAAATWLGVLAFAWAAAATALLLRNRGAPLWRQALGGALVATSPVLLTWAGAGMEVPAAVAALATLLLLYESQRFAWLGVVAGCLLLLRPDAGLAIAAAAVIETARSRSLRPVLRAAPGFGLVVLPWLVGATLYYGSPLPNSGFAKRLQVEDWGTYLGMLGRTLWSVAPLLPFALLGAAASLRRGREALPALALAATVAGMSLAGFPGCGWYVGVPIYLVTLLAAEGAALAASAVAGAAPLASVVGLAALAGPFLGHVQLPRAAHDAKIDQWRLDHVHGRVGDWLREHAPAGASVGVDNIGYIGWRSGLRVVDMLGLVQQDVADAIGRGERDYALRTYRPELIAMWVGRGNSWKYAPPEAWFRENGYRVVFEVPSVEGRGRPAYAVFARVETRP